MSIFKLFRLGIGRKLGETTINYKIIERYEAETLPPPSGLNVPEMFPYIHFKAYSYLAQGPDTYRKRDAFGMPPKSASTFALGLIKQGCEQILKWRGILPQKPLESIGIQGFYLLTELLHFKVIEQSATSNGDDMILDKMIIKHAVTGEEVILYNLVEPIKLSQ